MPKDDLEAEDTLIVGGRRPITTRQKQIIAGGVTVVVAVTLVVVLVMIFAVPKATKSKRNVILMISDGGGPAIATLARTFSGKPLPMDPYLVGTVRTFSASSLVTDSAAGATAFACGKHTYNGGIGIDANATACGTVLEAASKKGMRTGVVATTRVTDATPASFCSHASDRKLEDFIASQELDQIGFQKGMSVILGGGREHFNARADNQDLLTTAQTNGYSVVSDKAGLANVTSGKVLGLFADDNMAYAIDRYANATINSTQPSLAEMTRKALELLANDDGFFVMLEGALVDVAEHVNDAATAVRELLGYQEAFSIAREFAEAHGNTVIICTSDHETGGLTLGMQPSFAPGVYPPYLYYPNILAPFNASSDMMANRIIAGEDIREVVLSSTNINLTNDEVSFISGYTAFSDLSAAIGKTTTARAYIGWTTHGHTGVDVNLYIYGLPDGYEEYTGNIENIDIAALIADLLDLDIEGISSTIKDFNTTGAGTAKVSRAAHSHDPFHEHL